MSTKRIKIGSRESKLAVIQSELVINAIKRVNPEIEIELITMKTTGDMILHKSLELVGGKGLFVKELDIALMEKRCDLSVHSLKDMPMEVPKELPVLAFSEREDERDVLILRKGLKELPSHPVIGTFSKRRIIQAEKLYPEASFKGIRGNIVTRLKKLDDGEYDALILAAAGIARMGYEDRIFRYFTTEEIIPAAGQGIMAIQGRADSDYSFLQKIDSRNSRIMALAERAFVRTLDGGCTSPAAACSELIGERLRLHGLYYDEATGRYLTGTMEGTVLEAERLGNKLARRLMNQFKEGKTGGGTDGGTKI